jgi:Uma2 family endonuclease
MATAAPLGMPYEGPDEPDVSNVVTEDDCPVDLASGRQQRLLVRPLYDSWSGPPPEEDGAPRPFLAAANVGLFAAEGEPPIVPDFFLSLDVVPRAPHWEKKNRTYFFFVFGKPPDLVLEVVSNREGDELGGKRRKYARMRIPYYVVYDPERQISKKTLQAFELRGLTYAPIDPWFEDIGLGLVEWKGEYEGMTDQWIRWRTKDGALLPTGTERAQQEKARADTAEARADTAEARAQRLAERLRALGIDPDAEG